MAADPGEITTLARKLRGKGLDDEKVRESLRGLGFSKADADRALSSLGPTGTQPAGVPKESKPPTPQPAGPSSGGLGGIPTPSIPTPDLSKVSLTPPRRPSAGDLGGFFAGLVLYALALNYIRFGPAGVKGWLGAKFVNRPATGLRRRTGTGGSGGAGTNPDIPDTGLVSTRPAVTSI